MTHSPTTAPRRRTFGRLVAAAAVTALTAAGTLMYAATAGATVSTVSTITAVSPHRVSDQTANQIITVTGTGFDTDSTSAVAVDACTGTSFIVVSATSLVIKTGTDCATSSTGVITVTDSSGDATSVPATAAQALTFIAAPQLVTPGAAARPVMTDNSSGLTFAQVTAHGKSASTKGGTVVRVVSGATTGFVSSTLYPLSATLGGVAMTGVTLVGVSGTAGNYFTGITGAHATDAAPLLKITSNGVSKAFPYAASIGAAGTHDFQYAGSSITVTPNYGASNGGNKLTITGAGFHTGVLESDNVVTVGANACTITTPAVTATTLTCTAPITTLAALEGPVIVTVAVTGGLTSIVGSGSTYTYVAK